MARVSLALTLLLAATQAAFAGLGPVSVPEPATLSLLGLAVGAAAIVRRLRK